EHAARDLLVQCREPAILRRSHVELQRLGRRVRKAIAAGQIPGPVVRVEVLSSFLTDMLIDVLSAFLLRHGVIAELVSGPYGAIATALLDRKGRTKADPDVFLLLPTHRDLLHTPAP